MRRMVEVICRVAARVGFVGEWRDAREELRDMMDLESNSGGGENVSVVIPRLLAAFWCPSEGRILL